MTFFNSNDVKMYLINISNKSKISKYFNFQRAVSVDDDVDNSEKEEQQEGRILYLIHKFIKFSCLIIILI